MEANTMVAEEDGDRGNDYDENDALNSVNEEDDQNANVEDDHNDEDSDISDDEDSFMTTFREQYNAIVGPGKVIKDIAYDILLAIPGSRTESTFEHLEHYICTEEDALRAYQAVKSFGKPYTLKQIKVWF